MNKKAISLMTIIMFTGVIIGCETTKEHKGAATGAAVGAATGAAAGAVLGKKGSKVEQVGRRYHGEDRGCLCTSRQC